MSTQIGEVNINLRLSLAQFSKDVRDGTNQAKTATQDMATSMRGQTQEAKAAMALLGEEIGVTIPRHLRTFIASLPGVSTAMSAAFNSIAVLALIELFVKIIEKVNQWEKKAEEAAQAAKAIGTEGQTALHKLDEEIVSLQGRIAALRGDSFTNLQRSLQLINLQKWDGIIGEVNKLGKTVDEVHSKLQRDWFENLVGLGSNADLKVMKEQFDALLFVVNDMQSKGAKDADVYQQIDGLLHSVTNQLTTQKGLKDDMRQALTAEQSALVAMEAIYRKYNEVAADKTTVLNLEAMNNAARDMRKEMQAAVQSMEDLHKHLVAPDVRMQMGTTPMPIGPGPDYGGTAQAKELADLQTNQNMRLNDARKIYTEIRTPLQQYNDELARLEAIHKELDAMGPGTYEKAVKEAKDKLDGTSKAYQQLGKSIGQTIEQGLLFGRSWTDALKSILVQLTELILKMTVLKSLQETTGGSGVGGFFGGLLSGVLGGHRAGGGNVYSGTSYVVGENGPELFTPGASGFITPNGMGGGGRVYNIDARGSTNAAETEMRVRRAIQESERRAVSTALAMTAERDRRTR